MTTSGDEGAPAAEHPQGLKGLWIDTILDALDTGDDRRRGPQREGSSRRRRGRLRDRRRPGAGRALGRPRHARSPAPCRRAPRSAPRRCAVAPSSWPASRASTVLDLRGNVDTRLRKLAEGEVDAAVLAAAGLARLGVTPDHATPLPLVRDGSRAGSGVPRAPVPGRRRGRPRRSAARSTTRMSHAALDAERSVMWRLGGGCALPLGAYAEPIEGGLKLTAVIAVARRQRDPAGRAVGGDPGGCGGPGREGPDRRRGRADPGRRRERRDAGSRSPAAPSW